MKIVLDSNVLVAAFATRGLCNALFEHCLQQHSLILSQAILSEVQRALKRKVKLPAQETKNILRFLRLNAKVKKPARMEQFPCRDPNDAHVLALAITANVYCIVSGDRDLLELKKVGHIPILSPREFWQLEQAQTKI